ncbi:MAG: hypothetical protein NC347_09870 [Clostridium sp.]|nr:hypothetical protein [Clostridium sp.]
MNQGERQIIGMLADDLEANGKQNVFINRSSAIQYMVKPLMLPTESADYFTGYISSFEDDVDYDDDYLSDDERIEKFTNSVDEMLFVYSYRVNYDREFSKMQKVNLVPKPNSFDKDTRFFAIPVFAAGDDELVNDWENEHRWKLYRDYKDLNDFFALIRNGKSVGSVYGYRADDFTPSFVIWKDSRGSLFAVGNIESSHYDALGGLNLEAKDIFKIDITDYIKFVVYNIDINPTLMYIPDTIYKKIEDELLKASMEVEKNNGVSDQAEIFLDAEEQMENMQSQAIREINTISNEELEEIDVSEKTDKLIIQSMDYHSLKRNLYYSMKDFVNVHTAIKCNSLVIFSGLSGTGKSAMVDIYARALGINYSQNPDDNRLLFIPVRPSWNDDADLLGYVDLVNMVYRASDTGFVDFLVNSQKDENKNKMFIVCFDEMNLARVEHYFSRFLSILERPANQRELQLYDNQYIGRLYNSSDYPSRIKIGDNIRFVGTVNIDESTYHFSDKVLDRANVIQLEVLNYAQQWKKKQYGTLANINWTYDDYNGLIKKTVDFDLLPIHELLWDMHELMRSASGKYGIGPRIVKSIESYIINLPDSDIEGFNKKIGLDYQIMQRVLTKVRGPENQIGNILRSDSDKNFYRIFDKYNELSEFIKCREVIEQKQKELEIYGYCI